MEDLSDLWQFVIKRRKYWLLPLILLLLVLGVLIAAGEGSALGPFIYTLF